MAHKLQNVILYVILDEFQAENRPLETVFFHPITKWDKRECTKVIGEMPFGFSWQP
jgi:hypothetical protein